MNQQEINIIRTQSFKSSVNRILGSVMRRPNLGFKKNFTSRHTRASHCSANRFFVCIHICRINKPVTAFKRSRNRIFRFIRCEQIRSYSENRHCQTVVQLNIFHKTVPFDNCSPSLNVIISPQPNFRSIEIL